MSIFHLFTWLILDTRRSYKPLCSLFNLFASIFNFIGCFALTVFFHFLAIILFLQRPKFIIQIGLNYQYLYHIIWIFITPFELFTDATF
ncbi:hypothetical protein C2G38_2053094 [Gigaspora rosea]|uniref:Uncharacterized protein n=1 Tax=Gigaspora rosea TaxID=44941 RepID=A0A397W7D5_9GLOM|nr:hypothetical protein C2G38_2053094 [Gigaspora rosea]